MQGRQWYLANATSHQTGMGGIEKKKCSFCFLFPPDWDCCFTYVDIIFCPSFFQHPYPTEDEKRQIAAQTNLTLLQVNNWWARWWPVLSPHRLYRYQTILSHFRDRVNGYGSFLGSTVAVCLVSCWTLMILMGHFQRRVFWFYESSVHCWSLNALSWQSQYSSQYFPSCN